MTENPTRGTLEYAGGRAGPSPARLVGVIVIGAFAFALGHWLTEIIAQLVYLQGRYESTERALEVLLFSMVIESAFAVAEFVVFLVAQFFSFLILRRLRRGRTYVAAILGCIYCLARWALWFMGMHNLPQVSDLLVALGLTVVGAGGLFLWDWSGKQVKA